MATQNKLEVLATRFGGSIVSVESSERCSTHQVALAAQELITSASSVHRRTICPFASREECSNMESIVHVL